MNINKYITWLGKVLLGSSMLLFAACEDDRAYSEDYDINLPVSSVTSFTPTNAQIEEQIDMTGENLDMVKTVFIGNATCQIISQSATSMVVKIPRSAEKGQFLLTNKYKRKFTTDSFFDPEFPDVTIDEWPAEIERGKSFSIVGKNVDMITHLKIKGEEVARQGIATAEKISFTTDGMTLDGPVMMEVTTKTKQTLISPAIQIVEPSLIKPMRKSIVLMDFDNILPKVDNGDATPSVSGISKGSVMPYYGKYYTIANKTGNGWNGIFQYLIADNGGSGYDLSDYSDPHITFLINTNGKRGYFCLGTTIGGSRSDKHFTGQTPKPESQKKDDYSFETNGWEWRSYSIAKMGFENVNSLIETVELWVRGGNVGDSEPFEINIDQVMITDGALMPVNLLDFESEVNLSQLPGAKINGNASIEAAQGEKYLHFKTNSPGGWTWIGDVSAENVDLSAYASAGLPAYANFLINTGAGDGYLQIEVSQGDNKRGMHLTNKDAYGDDYMFKNTGGLWEWRTYKIDLAAMENWGGDGDVDLSMPVKVKFGFSTGNVASGLYEVNLDGAFMSAVPFDPRMFKE